MLEKRMVCEVPLANTASKYDDATNRWFSERLPEIYCSRSPHI